MNAVKSSPFLGMRRGLMNYNKRRCIYEKVVTKVLTKPATVTVESGGGSDTKPVSFR